MNMQIIENYIPMVLEQSNRGERSFDIFSRLLRERIVFIGTEIDDDLSNIVIAQLLYLDSENPEKDITIYINSPGGVITSGMAIYDTMQVVHADIATICVGQAASMGAFLLAAGENGKRMALPNSRIMIHQPSGGVRGQASDIEIEAKEIKKLKDKINSIMAEKTKKSIEQIEKDSDRDYYMIAEEALEYGLIDKILYSQRTVKQL